MSEEEVQARVNYKLNQVLTALENTASTNWSTAFLRNSAKHSHYWEAFNQMKGMLQKEMELPCPFDQLAEALKRNARDNATDKIVERLKLRGTRGYHEKQRFISDVIESIQNK